MNEQPIEDRIAQRVVARILPYLNGNGAKPTLKRLLSVREAAIYLGRYKENRAGVKEPSESSIYHLASALSKTDPPILSKSDPGILT